MSWDELDRSEPEIQIRRILVALDASPGCLECLEGAVELAARWKAELMGLFVEDIDLLHLAAAASATRFVYPTATERPLSLLDMESELRALEERARSELGRAAAVTGVRWSFRTVRGRPVAEILLAGAEADLLSFGGGWSKGHAVRRSSAVRPGPASAPQRFPSSPPILTVYDGSEGAVDACRFAARLAKMYASPLTVLLLVPSARQYPEMETDAARLLGAETLQLRFRTIDLTDESDFLRVVREEKGEVLVINGQSPLLKEETVGALVRDGDKTILVVGTRSGPGIARRQP